MRMKVDTKELDSLFEDLTELKHSVMQSAYKHFVSTTPVGDPSTWKSAPPPNYKPGNARRNTKLDKDVIVADYPYAERLDKGWSKQAPKGMTEPTEKFIENEIQNILKGR